MKPSISPKDIAQCRDCVSTNLRMTTRAITQVYDEIMQSSGLRGTQFTLMAMVFGMGPVTITGLAEALIIDRTTLTRNLKPLSRQKLIHIYEGEDRRTREVVVTNKGREVIAKALPLWEKAQAHILKSFGDQRWKDLSGELKGLISASHIK
ncbi:MAG TPA: MarR family transcriptional regulator [Spirochaetes bacterium]|nr:MarR family transcriptional regulator [Spirochaetota bacterium]